MKQIPLGQLKIDAQSPRLAIYDVDCRTSQQQLIQVYLNEMGINILINSIISSGFWPYSPLVVIEDDDDYIVLDGNRRLVAAQIINNPDTIKNIPHHIRQAINDFNDKQKIITVPSIVVPSRKSVWQKLLFDHITGGHWDVFTKAKFIDQIHNEYAVPLPEISYALANKNWVVQRFYEALKVLEQARSMKVYNHETDVAHYSRVRLNLLYHSLMNESVRQYLGMIELSDSDTPVPQTHQEELGWVLKWIYGKEIDRINPVVTLKNLDQFGDLLAKQEGVISLKIGERVEDAYDSCYPETSFPQQLYAAEQALKKLQWLTVAIEKPTSTDYLHATRLTKMSMSVQRSIENRDDQKLDIGDNTQNKRRLTLND